MVLSDIHRLRGIAILFIVATHCVTFFEWTNHPFELAVAKDLFDNSTVIFVFISGFLFQYTSPRFTYGGFVRTKFANVLLPYLILAAPGIAYVLLRGQPSTFEHLGLGQSSLVDKVAFLYLYGGSQVNYALWFIPVICIYFIFSPLLVQLVRWPVGYTALAVLLPVSVFMHRPSYAHGHNFGLALYFLSAFIGGMLCSQYRLSIAPFIDRHLRLFVGTTLLLFLSHLVLSNHHGKYVSSDKLHGTDADGLIDWIFIQKILLTVTLWAAVRRFQPFMRWLEGLARVSFTVFFLHLYVIFAAEAFMHFQRIEVSAPSIAMLMLGSVGIPWLVALAVRRAFPQWSRMLVGS